MKQVLKYTPEFILVCYILLFLFFKHPGETWDRPINSDGKGYYAYLPAFFIYHDLSYKFVESYEEKYYPPDHSVFKEFRTQVFGKTINKCFPGLAILWLPFFLIAHLLSFLFGFPTDGYSLIYQYAISIAALFYLWLGCRFLLILLMSAGSSVMNASLITFIIAFGTNILYFTLVEDSMSHVYSFFLVTLFLYTVYRYFHGKTGKYFILSSILLGIIILVRPTNGMILLLVPLMAWLANPGIRFRLSSILHPQPPILHFTSGILVFLVILSLPLLLWHHTTGHWFVYQYGNERFHFLHPHFFSILFSFNRGWFVYTPVALIAVLGLWGLWKENKTIFLWTTAFLVIFIYVSSCWWMWYYASKCGQRIFIDLYAFIAILLFFLFRSFQKGKAGRILLASVLLLFTGLNIFQTYQHSILVFPGVDINREIYLDSFCRLHPQAKLYYKEDGIIARKTFFTDMEKPEGWENPWTVRTPFGTSGRHCSMITSKHPYSVGRYETLAPMFISPNRMIRVSAMVWSPGKRSGSSIVVEVNSGEQRLSYNSFYLEPYVQADQWTPVETAFYIPRGIPEKSVAKIYFFNNKGSVPLFIDDLTIDFISLKDEVHYTRLDGVQIPVK
ncbi:MAG: hypothetical protein NTW10_13455 [Bacteroidetes bacterium]|nr:hypothetical protein [Bacteroidota bacterium]